MTYQDPDHSEGAHRYVTVGESTRGRVILVAHLDRGDRIRIISARRATRKEAHEYGEER
ncbi:MAG: BrnT family toxin [Thermoanaerobaculia bacterium]